MQEKPYSDKSTFDMEKSNKHENIQEEEKEEKEENKQKKYHLPPIQKKPIDQSMINLAVDENDQQEDIPQC
jgi:hypothetical protein